MFDPHDRPVLSDGQVTLRPPRDADVEARMAFGWAPQVLRGYGVDATSLDSYRRADAVAWVEGHARTAHHFMIEADDALVGSVFLHAIDAADRRATVAVGLLDDALLGRGIGTAALRLILGYGFDTLGLHRIALRVLADNARAIACYRNLGFVEEGRLRQNAWVAGGWQDDILMGLLSTEFAR